MYGEFTKAFLRENDIFYLEPCVDRLEGGVRRVLQPVNLCVHQLAGLGQLEIKTK